MAHTFFHNITYLSSSSMPKEKDAKPAISATSCLENIVKVDNKTHIFFSHFTMGTTLVISGPSCSKHRYLNKLVKRSTR